jgi:hypothetical protein
MKSNLDHIFYIIINFYLLNQQLKNISDSTFEFSEIEDEMNENDKYLK